MEANLVIVDGQPISSFSCALQGDACEDRPSPSPGMLVDAGVVPRPPLSSCPKRPVIGAISTSQVNIPACSRAHRDSLSPARVADERISAFFPPLQSPSSVSPRSTSASRSGGVRSAEAGFRRVTTDPEYFSSHRSGVSSGHDCIDDDDDDDSAAAEGDSCEDSTLCASASSPDDHFASPSVSNQDELWRILSSRSRNNRASQR